MNPINDMSDFNSIMIKLELIRNNGKVTISHNNITVFIQFFDHSIPTVSKEISKYERIITYNELESLYHDIELIKDDSSNVCISNDDNFIYIDFQKCFEHAKNIQKQIKILHDFGKTFVYENYNFDDLNKKDRNIYFSLETLAVIFKTNMYDFLSYNMNQKVMQISYPPFLTRENLLFFGYLLQKQEEKNDKEEEDIYDKENTLKEFLYKMFSYAFKHEIFDEVINDAQNKKYVIDPLKCSIQMFSNIYKQISIRIKYSLKKIPFNHDRFDDCFKNLQKKLQSHFDTQNFLIIKVELPSETYHILNVISSLLYNDLYRIPLFYEHFFCFEDSDIDSYFSEVEKNDLQIAPKFNFIIHPEFLSRNNQNKLKEKILSNMNPFAETIQKHVVITSSSDFIIGNPPDDLNGKVFTCGQTSIKVDASLMRDYTVKYLQPYFTVRIYQSLTAGSGKTTFINQEIKKIQKEYNNYKFNVFHHFINDANQRIPIESFKIKHNVNNIIHFQFSDDFIKKGMKFWSGLYQLYTYGYYLPKDEESFIIDILSQNLVIFEIPLQSLREFPLPISSVYPKIYESISIFHSLKPIKIHETIVNRTNEFKTKSISYIQEGIDSVVNCLKNKPTKNVTNLKDYIELMYNEIFSPKEKISKFEISYRKLGYIGKYLNEYTILYNKSLNNIHEREFATFFYLLTITAFYSYNCVPKEMLFDLTFVTVNDLFDETIENKKIQFYTTKKTSDLFNPLISSDLYQKNQCFSIIFGYDGKNPIPQEVLNNIFCSLYEFNITINDFKKNNPQSCISHMQMNVQTLYRLSIILNRIFLSQPIVLSGDTGCGKTFSINAILEYFKFLNSDINNELNIKVGKTLNCHDGITTEDVIKYLKNESENTTNDDRKPQKCIIFFNEFNTSPASSYIEHLILGKIQDFNPNFIFIGAINPLKKKNPISSIMTKVGLSQCIEDNDNYNDEDDLMYQVYHLQEATQDIIFDFDPICYQSTFNIQDSFYTNDEKQIIHLIIDKMAKNPIGDNRKAFLHKFYKYINICIRFIRIIMNERAVISYRDVERTMIIYNKIYEYYNNCEKNEVLDSDLPIISIIVSFVLRLPSHLEINEKDFDQKYAKIFRLAYELYFGQNDYNYSTFKDGKYIINMQDKLISLLGDVDKIKNVFMTFVYQYTFEYLKDDSILKFQSTFIHLFVMDICIRCKIPCFVIGMPGTSKSYSVKALKKNYKNKLNLNTYMSTCLSSINGIKSLYYDVAYKEIKDKINEKTDCYSAVFIDNIENLNINGSRSFSFLHEILDCGLDLNRSGCFMKIATITASKYYMNFADMNRGLLIYTDIPDLREIVKVFSLKIEKEKFKNAKSFINYKQNINCSHIIEVFNNLWENNMPITISLRSIFNIRYLIDQQKFNVHIVCRILRELFNSKRLEYGEKYKDLVSICPKNIKYDGFNNINNLACFLERVSCVDTESNKSLTIFTKNYEVIEYFDLFMDDNFIEFLQTQFKEFKIDKNKLHKFQYLLFGEDFIKKPEELSHDALKLIVECATQKKDANILIIGNHPCIDSCLDLLDVSHNIYQCEREVTLGSEFSKKIKLINSNFYITMITNIDDIKNRSNSQNQLSLQYFDRTETIYLDWDIISPYYLQYKYKYKILNFEKAKIEQMENAEILSKHAKYETIEPEILHLNIEILYNNKEKVIFDSIILSKLVRERWESGIKAVILTKSKIHEDIYLPYKLSNKFILMKNDFSIDDFSQLKQSIDDIENNSEQMIIIKCTSFNKIHFIHLKNFFDQISCSTKSRIKYNIFIIYYGCNPIEFEGLSTFKWPILAMDDISIHPELETQTIMKKTSNRKINEINAINQITNQEVVEMISKLNKMDTDTKNRQLHYFFHKIFDAIVESIERNINIYSKHNIDISKNYFNSDFCIYSDYFENVKEMFELNGNIKYFDIKIDNNSFILSKKSQIISHVYHALYDKIQSFIILRFGSQIIQRKSGQSNLDHFFLFCQYFDFQLERNRIYQYDDVYEYLFFDFTKFLLCNSVKFDDAMLKKKFIADRLLTAIGQPKEALLAFEYMCFNHFEILCDNNILTYITDITRHINDEETTLISLQTIADFDGFRCLAGLDITKHQSDFFWDKYINYCVFFKIMNLQNFPSNRDTMIKSIAEYHDKSIFDIFVSPIKKNNRYGFDLCKKLTCSNEFSIKLEANDKGYQIYKSFNEDSQSLKSDKRFNSIKQKINDGSLTDVNKEILLSMIIFYATSKWDTGRYEDIIPILDIANNFNEDDFSRHFHVNRDYRINEVDLNLSKYKDFGRIWHIKYRNIQWEFKGDCFIDETQSIINNGSNTKPEFKKWLCCGFEYDEPLSIIALRRFLNSQNDETRSDLAKILDPFFGDNRIVDLFIDNIDRKLRNDSPFPFNEIVEDNLEVMGNIRVSSVFRFSVHDDINTIYHYRKYNPLLAQIIWFHVTFNKPSQYPLTSLLIKESSFFIDYQVVPKIINSLVHIRHIFSYNPVYIPIILHRTSLFKNCDCKLLLYSLGYFSRTSAKNNEDDLNIIKEFENIQIEIDSFEEFVKTNFNDLYEIIRHQSAYYQISFILRIYFKKYNEIIEKINECTYISKEYKRNKKLTFIEASSILPNMLITNFTLINILLPFLYENSVLDFKYIEEAINKIFDLDCFQLSNEFSSKKYTFPLFKVRYDDNKDYIGYTEYDYEQMFLNYIKIGKENLRIEKLTVDNSSINFHASVLSFFLHIYLNKDDDDLSSYDIVKTHLNDLSNVHLNTYAHYIDYDLQINEENLIFGKGTINFEKKFTLYFEANILYPLQSIFKYIPETLKNEILTYQEDNEDGFQLIDTENNLFIEEEEE